MQWSTKVYYVGPLGVVSGVPGSFLKDVPSHRRGDWMVGKEAAVDFVCHDVRYVLIRCGVGGREGGGGP